MWFRFATGVLKPGNSEKLLHSDLKDMLAPIGSKRATVGVPPCPRVPVHLVRYCLSCEMTFNAPLTGWTHSLPLNPTQARMWVVYRTPSAYHGVLHA